jgi:hypothetical protein
MRRIKERTIIMFPFAFIGLALVVSAIAGAFLWPYTVNTWLAFFDKAQAVAWWHGALLGVIPGIGQAVIPLAVITWVAMLFL